MKTSWAKVSISILVLCLGFVSTLALADIYRYRDENGVWHFTNIMSDPRYRLYIRTYSKSGSVYIKEYESIINKASKRFSVDPLFVKAVIKAESDFDHKAISHKGAQGLMQLMPETADAMKVSNPFDPEENIHAGVRYLSLLLERFRNDKKLALAAYNAGPEKVDVHKGIPPYTETRTFVRKVLAYYDGFKSSVR